MSKGEPEIRRTDRATGAGDLMGEVSRLRRPLAGESELADALNAMVSEGELYEKLPGGRVHCFACGHHCKISDGGRGVCQVRYNLGGKLYVPRGYVAALASDPIEKKPFFHVYPGSDALTFGMLGCDLHCGYCFAGDTPVVTDRGPIPLEQAFQCGARYDARPDAEIAYPDGLRAVTASGQLQTIEAVFKHPYRGPLAVIQPYYLPALTCTPEHRIYATADAEQAPTPLQARDLTPSHYLAIPRSYAFSTVEWINAARELGGHRVTYQVPWDLSIERRQEIVAATAAGHTSRQIDAKWQLDPSYIRHARSKIAHGLGTNSRTKGAQVEGDLLRFPNEHRPGIPNKIRLDARFARLLGYYCAEGSVVRSSDRPNSLVLNFSFGPHEEGRVVETRALLEQCLGVQSASVARTTTRAVTVNKASAALLFESLAGSGADGKRVPPALFSAPREVAAAFLDAYVQGDGHRYSNGKVSVTTVSRELAYGIAWLALKLGHVASVYDERMLAEGTIQGRPVKRAPHQYSVIWYEQAEIARHVVETKDYYLIPLRGIRYEEYDGFVYNLQVAGEHNYLAGFFLVSNCQNWDISQALRDASAGRPPTLVSAPQLVQLGQRYGARVVASSYNEPLITSEWAVEVMKEAQANGLLCAYVSNGNATREVLEYIRPYVSAYKIDLKSMRDKQYRQLGVPLQNVLDGVRMVHELGFWLEIVTLVVPGFNDSPEELRDAAQFIASVSRDIPWHVTAFHSDYRMRDHDNTSSSTLLRAAELGRAAGLNFVYAGNLPGNVGGWENTACPNCHAALIERYAYTILDYRITRDGTCPNCGTRVPGIWPDDPGQVTRGSANQWFLRRPRAVR